jgi:hypothetical protein
MSDRWPKTSSTANYFTYMALVRALRPYVRDRIAVDVVSLQLTERRTL